jgi:hypothetical protein
VGRGDQLLDFLDAKVVGIRFALRHHGQPHFEMLKPWILTRQHCEHKGRVHLKRPVAAVDAVNCVIFRNLRRQASVLPTIAAHTSAVCPCELLP